MAIVELLHFLVYGRYSRTYEHIEASVCSHLMGFMEDEFLHWVQLVMFRYTYLLSSHMKVEVVEGQYKSFLDNVMSVCPGLVGTEAFSAWRGENFSRTPAFLGYSGIPVFSSGGSSGGSVLVSKVSAIVASASWVSPLSYSVTHIYSTSGLLAGLSLWCTPVKSSSCIAVSLPASFSHAWSGCGGSGRAAAAASGSASR